VVLSARASRSAEFTVSRLLTRLGDLPRPKQPLLKVCVGYVDRSSVRNASVEYDVRPSLNVLEADAVLTTPAFGLVVCRVSDEGAARIVKYTA